VLGRLVGVRPVVVDEVGCRPAVAGAVVVAAGAAGAAGVVSVGAVVAAGAAGSGAVGVLGVAAVDGSGALAVVSAEGVGVAGAATVSAGADVDVDVTASGDAVTAIAGTMPNALVTRTVPVAAVMRAAVRQLGRCFIGSGSSTCERLSGQPGPAVGYGRLLGA
jgi:hypothetical protein